MSLVVMRRKLAAKNRLNKNGGTRGGISSNSAFSLAYTNTGKNLMGRTVSRAKTLPPRLRSQKYRRVDCCPGPSEYIPSNYSKCVSSVAKIEKKPILQISNRNRLRRLTSTHCPGDKCRDTSVDSGRLWKLSPNQYASDLIDRLAALNIDSESGCYYEFKVTVVNDGGNNKFLLNGKRFGINFKVGNRYIFDVSDSTNATHPLRLVTIASGNANYDKLRIIGVQGEKNAKVIFTPQEKGNVLLTCSNHGKAMGSYYNLVMDAKPEINVTVAAKIAHPRQSYGSNDGYYLDGVVSPALKLVRGNTYRFKQNVGTNWGHPLQFWEKEDKTGTQYASTVVGNVGTAGAYVDFTVADDAPNKIYYQCGNHPFMGNYFDIVDEDDVGITVKDSDENLLKEKKCKDIPGPKVHNSLTRGRIKCGVIAMTKDITNNVVASNASDHIRKVKSRTLNADCITSIRPFNVKKCSPPV